MLLGRKTIGTVAYMGGVLAVAEEFCASWGQMIAYNAEFVCEPNERIHYDRSRMSFHSWARNGLAEHFYGDWLLMLDTDHSFEPDLLGRLLHRMNLHSLDVVCGLYQFRSPPHSPVIYGWYGEEDGGFAPVGGFDESLPLQSAAGAGGGCLLVKRAVYDRVRRELKEAPFDLIGQMGEDLSFFKRLRKLGIRAYVDTRVECHHLQVRPLTLADWERPPRSELMHVEDAVAIKE